jgi:hypothetical protein
MITQVFLVLFIFSLFCHYQGLILSKALKAQKDAEDKSTSIAFENLRSQVINLWHEAEEKDSILISLVGKIKETFAVLKSFCKEENTKVTKLEDEKKASAKHIADLESMLRSQAESHKYEMLKLKEKFDELNENSKVEKAKHEIVEAERDRV